MRLVYSKGDFSMEETKYIVKQGPEKRIHSIKTGIILYKEGDEFINENQQYQNGTNADESETDSSTA